MSKIERTMLIPACKPEVYEEKLNQVIDELQAQDLTVEVAHSMCQANKGVGYMYSAVVTGRKA